MIPHLRMTEKLNFSGVADTGEWLVAPAHFRSTIRPSTPGDTVPLAPM